ncbi:MULTISPECIES: signal peptidase II [Candidatus Ichthyocystis]|uniref:Lipoprotein signal peptidase n=1 Tax=Candidatus Ichthyocystis hellenicum TaxID=1561003 RepID=A0A0S4M004_9BURK|nr:MULTISPECIES: signal peptidase II [Ichthyocystis]CUT16929.1 putative peptidase A8 [Candidatus Ichthyocystis hellenicum]
MHRLRINAYIRWVLIFSSVISLDQLSKLWAIRSLMFYHPIYVNKYMNWNLVFNYGAAFGFMNHQNGWQSYLFVAITFLISTFFCILIYRGYLRSWGADAAFLIIAGGLSNAVDRMYRGAVLDFVQWHFHQWAWPSFNLADAAITLGVILLISYNQWGSCDRN